MFGWNIDEINTEYANKKVICANTGHPDIFIQELFYNSCSEECSIKSIESASKSINTIIESCDFFKFRDKGDLDRLSRLIKGINTIVMRRSGIILVNINLLGNEVYIDLCYSSLMIDGDILPLFKYAVEICDDIYFSESGITFSYVFSEKDT